MSLRLSGTKNLRRLSFMYDAAFIWEGDYSLKYILIYLLSFCLSNLREFIIYWRSKLHNVNKTGSTYNVTVKCVRATVVAVERQEVLHLLRICL